MKRRTKLTAGVLLGLLCVYPAFLLFNCASIEIDLWRRGKIEVRPVAGSRSLAEDGLVVAVRRERSLREKQSTLEWLVLIPSSSAVYICSYEEGFAGFAKGDTVTFVHTPVEMEIPDAPAYLIGHNHQKLDKVARVEPFETDGAGANGIDP